MIAFSSTTTAIATGVSHSRATTRLTTAATSKMMISRSWNCRRNARHRGSRGASASRFGPYRSSRRAASAVDRPVPGSTSSRPVTSSAAIACQAGVVNSVSWVTSVSSLYAAASSP